LTNFLGIEEEMNKNQKDLNKLREKETHEKNPQDNLLIKIKNGRVHSLKKSKLILQENKAKIRSLSYSLDSYLSILLLLIYFL